MHRFAPLAITLTILGLASAGTRRAQIAKRRFDEFLIRAFVPRTTVGFAAGFVRDLIVGQREALLRDHVVRQDDGFVHFGDHDRGAGTDSYQSADDEGQQMFRE
jgi:hypothetical protein